MNWLVLDIFEFSVGYWWVGVVIEDDEEGFVIGVRYFLQLVQLFLKSKGDMLFFQKLLKGWEMFGLVRPGDDVDRKL